MALMEAATTGATAGGALGGLPGAVVGAGIGIAGNFISGLFSQKYNQESINAQVQAQKELTDYNTKKQLAAQEMLWNDTNYPAQVKMMQQAGLNPALLYGKGGGGGATTGAALPTQSVNSHIDTNGGTNITQAALSMMMMKAQIENINADTQEKQANAAAQQKIPDVQTSQINLNEAQTEAKKIENQLNQINLNAANETYDDRIQQIRAISSQAISQAEILSNSPSIEPESKKILLAQMAANLAETNIKIEAQKHGIELTDREIWNIGKQVELEYKQINNNNTTNWEQLNINWQQLGLDKRKTEVLEDRATWQNIGDALDGIGRAAGGIGILTNPGPKAITPIQGFKQNYR